MAAAPNLNPATDDDEGAIRALPHDELLRYGRSLGLDLSDDLSSDDLFRKVSKRRRVIAGIERDALLEIIRWGHGTVRDSASNEEMVIEIARIEKSGYDTLSRRGLATLARLRGIEVHESDAAEEIIERLNRREGFWKRFHRKRRSVVGSWLSRIIDDEESSGGRPIAGSTGESQADIPQEGAAMHASPRPSLRKHIEDRGVVGGIAQRLRGAADDYIKVKLDEIEARIDQKLGEIDLRLAEWRDREVANRLRILRITLAFTVLVAVLSLAYNYAKRQVDPAGDKSPVPAQTGRE